MANLLPVPPSVPYQKAPNHGGEEEEEKAGQKIDASRVLARGTNGEGGKGGPLL